MSCTLGTALSDFHAEMRRPIYSGDRCITKESKKIEEGYDDDKCMAWMEILDMDRAFPCVVVRSLHCQFAIAPP